MSIIGVFLLLCLVPLIAFTVAREAERGGGAGLFLAAALGAACFTALFAAVFPDQVLVALALGIGAMLSLLGPVQAVAFLVANLILRPWETAVDHQLVLSVPKTLALLAVLSYALAVLQRGAAGGRQPAVRWNRMFGLFCALVAWFFTSTLFSFAPADSFKYLLDQFVPVAVTVFLIANSCHRPEHVRVLRAVLVIAVCGLVSSGLLQTVGQEGGEELTRLHTAGLWGNPNDLGALIAFVFPFVLFGKGTRASGFGVLLKTAVLALLAVGLWYTQSRGTVLALAAGMIVYFLFCSRSFLGFLAALASAAVLPSLFFLHLARNVEEVDTSTAARRNLAIAGVRMAVDHPVTGVGVDEYPKLYEMYTPSFEEWGERNAHSSWILALAETGFPGFALFVLLFLWALSAAWRLRKQHPEVLWSLISYGVAMSFLSHTYNLLPYLAAVLVLVVARTAEPAAERLAPPHALELEAA